MNQLPDDSIIIEMVLKGDQKAFSILVDRYRDYVFTLVMRYINNREQAEELAQDVFVKTYRSLADFRGDSKFSTWLYTIVNTTCLSFHRKKKEAYVLVPSDQLHILTSHPLHENITDRIEQKKQRNILQEAIKKLNSKDAQIITLFYLAEQSLEEIAKILSISTDQAKVNLFRARQRLKKIIEAYYSNSLYVTKKH